MGTLKLSISKDSLLAYTCTQVNLFYPDEKKIEPNSLNSILDESLLKLELCFKTICLPYYKKDGNTYFNHLHGDHYSAFLYLTSRQAFLNNDINLATKLFLLNKALFGIDVFYTVELPESFIFVHPIGTILGRAKYSNFFVVYQGVTVGANENGIYPDFSKKTLLFSNSSVIGNCKTGENFVLGARSTIINSNVTNNKIVVGNYPNIKVSTNSKNIISNYFY